MEGREVVSLGGVGHGEISEGLFGLTGGIQPLQRVISKRVGRNNRSTTKIHHATTPEVPPHRSKSYDVRRPYDELLPSHIRG